MSLLSFRDLKDPCTELSDRVGAPLTEVSIAESEYDDGVSEAVAESNGNGLDMCRTEEKMEKENEEKTKKEKIIKAEVTRVRMIRNDELMNELKKKAFIGAPYWEKCQEAAQFVTLEIEKALWKYCK